MENKMLEKMLGKLKGSLIEPVPDDLSEKIKQNIPQGLTAHRRPRDTVNIIIDLRVNKLTAAAAILLTFFLSMHFINGREEGSYGIIKESKMVLKYMLRGEKMSKKGMLDDVFKYYQDLIEEGTEAVYYGNVADISDTDSILLHWKTDDDRYRVIYCDLRPATVSSEELRNIHIRMLKAKE